MLPILLAFEVRVAHALVFLEIFNKFYIISTNIINKIMEILSLFGHHCFKNHINYLTEKVINSQFKNLIND